MAPVHRPALLPLVLVFATGLAMPQLARAQGLTVFSAAYLGANSTTSVMIGAEVNGLVPTTLGSNGRPREIDVRMTADAPTREERAVTVALADAATLDRAARDGIRVLVRMTLPPGRHTVRVDVRDNASGGDNAAASVVHTIDVPNLVDGPITMSDLAITSSTVGGVTQSEVEEDGSLPILARPPTGRRQFSRGERVEVNAEIYGAVSSVVPDDEPNSFQIATTLYAAGGTVVHETVEDGTSELLENGEYGFRHYTLVPIASLPPGTYVVRVAAMWNGVISAFRSVPITVTD